MKVVILKCGEELKEGEQMIGTRTVKLADGDIGYVAIIKKFPDRNIRYCSLQAEIRDVKMNDTVM